MKTDKLDKYNNKTLKKRIIILVALSVLSMFNAFVLITSKNPAVQTSNFRGLYIAGYIAITVVCLANAIRMHITLKNRAHKSTNTSDNEIETTTDEVVTEVINEQDDEVVAEVINEQSDEAVAEVVNEQSDEVVAEVVNEQSDEVVAEEDTIQKIDPLK